MTDPRPLQTWPVERRLDVEDLDELIGIAVGEKCLHVVPPRGDIEAAVALLNETGLVLIVLGEPEE